MRLIAAVTQSNPTEVTTTFAHGYISGTIVRLDIPPACGMQQMNGLTGTILVTGTTTFDINIDSTLFDAFSIPVSPGAHEDICAQVVPIGEVSAILTAAVQNILPFP